MTTESLIQRPYSDDDVERLRGSVTVEHTLARRGFARCSSRRSACRRSAP